MTVKIEKSSATGKVTAPPSKSAAHRLLIAAAMCKGQTSVIDNLPYCQDVLATIDCLKSLGVKIEYENMRAVVCGIDFSLASATDKLNCRESGSTLRFLIPLAWLCGKEVVFCGSEGLISRPQNIYLDIAKEQGLNFDISKNEISLCGRLTPGEYKVPGDVSSQFITGLIFALSTLKEDSRIIITTKAESLSYVEMTIDAIAKFGVQAKWIDDSTLLIRGGQKYSARNISVEGDYSSAAYALAFNHIGGNVSVEGLLTHSIQGDKAFYRHADALDKGFANINIEDCPDLGPVLFTLAAIKHGAKFEGTKRLKIKESDRAEVMKQELSKFGADLVVDYNSVTVKKTELHTPKENLLGHNDHRVVMSLAVICSLFGGEIEGAEAISKSYPDFFKDIKDLGISVIEV